MRKHNHAAGPQMLRAPAAPSPAGHHADEGGLAAVHVADDGDPHFQRLGYAAAPPDHHIGCLIRPMLGSCRAKNESS